MKLHRRRKQKHGAEDRSELKIRFVVEKHLHTSARNFPRFNCNFNHCGSIAVAVDRLQTRSVLQRRPSAFLLSRPLPLVFDLFAYFRRESSIL